MVANNRPNSAREGAILSTVPSGTGILHVGVDDSLISGNVVEDNDFIGIAVVDYCAAVLGGPFDCSVDPDVSPGFVADNEATGNEIVGNELSNNGTNPDPSDPFAFAASDLGLLTLGDHGNCYADNVFTTFFSLLGVPARVPVTPPAEKKPSRSPQPRSPGMPSILSAFSSRLYASSPASPLRCTQARSWSRSPSYRYLGTP